MSFSPANVALHGRHLIEASAGTGKTYSIANLFLRLLLEPHPSQPDQQPLTVDRILVVTFTNAATDELRGRIRRKIEDALQHFRGGDSDDAFIVQYRNESLADEQARYLACERLYSALLLVDDAAIFTIHGFAARAIQTFLFETGALADVEVVIGGSDSEAQHFDDLVRLLSQGPQRKLGHYLARQGVDGRKYVAALGALSRRPGVAVLENPAAVDAVITQYENERTRLLAERAVLANNWTAIDTKAKSYAALREELVNAIGGTVSARNITDCINFCNNKYAGIKGVFNVGKTQQVVLDSPNVATLSGIAKQLYDRVANLAAFNANEDAIKEAATASQSALLALLQQHPLPVDQAQLQPDDVIRLINARLDDPEAATILRDVLTAQYPVCMVDEFQDTDPEQFRLFDRLYQHTATRGLFAIGDPKQSIYAFRGADVFAYLDVKAGIDSDHRHSLDINFRSKQGVMDGVNALFREVAGNAPVFVYPGIEYETVYSCEQPPAGRGLAAQARGIYRVGASEPGSLVFIGNSHDQSETFNNTLTRYATDCAERILLLLQGEQRATVEKNGRAEPLRPGDIAILVRGYHEAEAMKKALARKRLAAVYLSQKDSVFRRCLFAKDLLFILRAMDDPSSLYHLKAAFATPLLRRFQTGTDLLDALDTDDGFEQAIQQFTAYCKRWEDRGIFSALYLLLAQQGLADVFAAHPECDRLMTDFRHLGDLLQQQYLLNGSRERLIDWYASQLADDSELDEEAKSLRLESDDNLVKIVTLHGCKGLEYPVVFIPFFFGFREVDLVKEPPFYHRQQQDGGWQTVLDFCSDKQQVCVAMNRERMAEDMRLLYVGITRAIYQCYIGISRSHHSKESNALLPKTCWGHLLGLGDDEAAPDWPALQQKLQQRMGDAPCVYDTLRSPTAAVFDPAAAANMTALVDTLPAAIFPASCWQVTSYSALAYQKDARVGSGNKQDETAPAARSEAGPLPEEERWQQDIRFRLRGGTNTGDCLHSVFERIAGGEALAPVLDAELRACNLATPEGRWPAGVDQATAMQQRQQEIAAWLQAVLAEALGNGVPSLQALFAARSVLPECSFDFSLGDQQHELPLAAINAVLQHNCGASSGIARKDKRSRIHGIMTGSIDLLFIHDQKIYVLDYKSNLLGKTPSCYDHASMQQAMHDSRYDLQYLIYSVAAHRYLQQRLGERYGFDGGEYSFGGVYYLFLRGMGLLDYPGHGVYFTRPTQQQIEALDAAFRGTEVQHG